MLKSGAEEWIFLKKLSTFKGPTVRKLIGAGGGGGGGGKKKKIFAQGKIEWKENHESQLTLDRIHATA